MRVPTWLCGQRCFGKSAGSYQDWGRESIGLAEETELSLRMRQAGFRLLYAPQILIRHRLPRKRLTKAFMRERFFQQGRAEAYYAPLPVSILRFGLYVIKETIAKEVAAVGHLCASRPAQALLAQCEARSWAGFFWQHWLFKRGVPRRVSDDLPSAPKVEVESWK